MHNIVSNRTQSTKHLQVHLQLLGSTLISGNYFFIIFNHSCIVLLAIADLLVFAQLQQLHAAVVHILSISSAFLLAPIVYIFPFMVIPRKELFRNFL